MARKCREVVKNTEKAIAIELLCSAQAMDPFINMKPGEGTLVAYKTIRDAIPHMDRDRMLPKDIETMMHLMRSGKIIEAVEKSAGKFEQILRKVYAEDFE